ncbi:MAG TPA: hypothetical protein DIW47_16205 [Bacteroidetes bacterium]|nr:hypothetical protein [Bacteroidota bacterium]
MIRFKMKLNKLRVLLFVALSFAFNGRTVCENRQEHSLNFPGDPGNNFCTRSARLDSVLIVKTDTIAVYALRPIRISDSLFALLTHEEHLIHALDYPEQYRQICSLYSIDPLAQKKIHAYFRNDWGERSMSERQRAALKENRTEVIDLIKGCLKSDDPINNRMKDLIVELNATECIPEMVDRVKRNKQTDTYYFTCMLLLIKNNNPELLEGTEFERFYTGSNRIYDLRKTTERMEKILTLVQTFYQSTFD